MKRRSRRDPVTQELRAAVLLRDGRCLAAVLDRSHVCKDRWGTPHEPDRLDRLTIEHVKDAPRMGVRAPSDQLHLVALCHSGNAVEHWGSANRAFLYAYLLGVAAAGRI